MVLKQAPSIPFEEFLVVWFRQRMEEILEELREVLAGHLVIVPPIEGVEEEAETMIGEIESFLSEE